MVRYHQDYKPKPCTSKFCPMFLCISFCLGPYIVLCMEALKPFNYGVLTSSTTKSFQMWDSVTVMANVFSH